MRAPASLTGRRVAFFATPSFALPSLDAMITAGATLRIVTRPPRPAGRGHRLTESPVASMAAGQGLVVLTPQSLRDPAFEAQLRAFEPDLIVTVAFGRILPPALLAIPRVAAVNLHPSPLPALRGPAPIPRALLSGMATTAVAVIHMEEATDTGDIIAMEPVAIFAGDDLGRLTERLARAGAQLLLRSVLELLTGRAQRRPQVGEPSWAPVLGPGERVLDFTRPATELQRQVRALAPVPGALTTIAGRRLKVLMAVVGDGGGPAGVVLGSEGAGLRVGCGEGCLHLLRVVPAGRAAMDGAALLRGHPELLGAACQRP